MEVKYSAEKMNELAKDCEEFFAANERRSPTSKFATLGELDALFRLKWTLKHMEEND